MIIASTIQKKYLQSGMGTCTLIFSQMTQIMKEPRYQLWPILVCKAKKPNISIIKITIQWWNDLETVNITNLSLVFFLSEVLDLHLAK